MPVHRTSNRPVDAASSSAGATVAEPVAAQSPAENDTTESDADAGGAAIPAKVEMRFMTVPLPPPAHRSAFAGHSRTGRAEGPWRLGIAGVPAGVDAVACRGHTDEQ